MEVGYTAVRENMYVNAVRLWFVTGEHRCLSVRTLATAVPPPLPAQRTRPHVNIFTEMIHTGSYGSRKLPKE